MVSKNSTLEDFFYLGTQSFTFSALVVFTNLVALGVRPRFMALPNVPYIHEYANVRDWVTEQATEPGLDILQSCSFLASYCVKDVEFESVIAVWASVFALKVTHAQLVVSFINATPVFGNEGPAFDFNLLRLQKKNKTCFFFVNV